MIKFSKSIFINMHKNGSTQQKCIIVCGPTASGKSSYVLSIPNADIINGDSLQVYKDLKILTARPDGSIPNHYLYGYLEANKQIHVMDWVKSVDKQIQDSLVRGKIPVITGGTGFYLKVLTEGIAEIPEIPNDITNEVRQKKKDDLETLANKIDPQICMTFSDKQRIQRAVMVFLATGQSIFKFHKKPKIKLPYIFKTHCLFPEKKELDNRINERFKEMIDQGAIEEVAKLKRKLEPGVDLLSLPIARAIGFHEIYQYLEGNMTKEKMSYQGQLKTRQYAKRQMTWFRKFQRDLRAVE